MNGRKRLIILGVVIILLVAVVPVLVSATPLATSDIKLHTITPKHVGQRFRINGNLTGWSFDPVLNIGAGGVLPGRTVEIYKKMGDTWNNPPLATVTTDAWGGFGLPWQEFSKGKRHYMAVFRGDGTFPGSYDKVTVRIE